VHTCASVPIGEISITRPAEDELDAADAMSKKCPKTGAGVIRRLGHGPHHGFMRGERASRIPKGDENAPRTADPSGGEHPADSGCKRGGPRLAATRQRGRILLLRMFAAFRHAPQY
jgi:hypothetical protein